jgi:hypothetical protein
MDCANMRAILAHPSLTRPERGGGERLREEPIDRAVNGAWGASALVGSWKRPEVFYAARFLAGRARRLLRGAGFRNG